MQMLLGVGNTCLTNMAEIEFYIRVMQLDDW